ncbi:MAG: secretin and TonB N-terminal domain-containing protein [Fimbriimonas sp.]
MRTLRFLTVALCVFIFTALSFAQAKPVTNVFTDTDLKQALSDIAAQSGVMIVADDTVTGTVSANLKDVPLEEALTIVLAAGGYSWIKENGYYLVGKAEPTSTNFLKFAQTKLYKPSHMPAEQLANLMPAAFTPYIKAVAGQNQISIVGSPQMLERILKDLHTLDAAPQKIILEALVTELTTETLNRAGFSWIWSKFGFLGDDDDNTGESDWTLKYTAAAVSDVVKIKALIGDGKATVRANPRIMSIEGKEANVEVAQESWFQVVSGPASYPYTTLQQIKTGISLKMTSTVAENGEITIQLAPEVSDAAGAAKNGLPVNTVRRANTTVRVREGETIVIGGMTYAASRNRSNKIPILGDIPILGLLFRSTTKETRNTEVIIMITPRIVR